STAWPASSAASSAAWISRSSSAPSALRSITPAPPWITSAVGEAGSSCAVAVMAVVANSRNARKRVCLTPFENPRIPVGTSPAKRRGVRLLPQGFDGVELGSLAGGVVAEEQAGGDGEARCKADH